MRIRLNQIYKQVGHNNYVLIAGKKGSLWKAKVLGDKVGVYKGTHTLNEYTLKAKYELVA